MIICPTCFRRNPPRSEPDQVHCDECEDKRRKNRERLAAVIEAERKLTEVPVDEELGEPEEEK